MKKKTKITLPEGQSLSIIPLSRTGREDVTIMTTYPVQGALMADMARHIQEVENSFTAKEWAKLHKDHKEKKARLRAAEREKKAAEKKVPPSKRRRTLDEDYFAQTGEV